MEGEVTGFPNEVVFPDVVGMVVQEARAVAQTAGVVLARRASDGLPLSVLTWRLPVIVTSGSPPAGTQMRRHHSVVVTYGCALSGVREPRRPVPRRLADRPSSTLIRTAPKPDEDVRTWAAQGHPKALLDLHQRGDVHGRGTSQR